MGGTPIIVRGTGVTVTIGTSGIAPATLDAERLSRHFLVSAGAVLTLRNIVLRNGFVEGPEDGGCVHVSGTGSAVRLLDVQVRDSEVDGSGFLDSRGGGIFASDGGTVNASSCEFRNLTAAFGGAVCMNAGFLNLGGCSIHGCRALRGGSFGLQYSGTRPSFGHLTNCDISDCFASRFAGAGYILSSHLVTHNVNIRRCTTTTLGGAIWAVSGMIWAVSHGSLDFSDTLFEDCYCSSGCGGIGAMDYSGAEANEQHVRLERVTVRRCSAATYGGGGYFFKVRAELTDVTFDGCSSGANGGGLDLAGSKAGFPATFNRVNFTGCTTSTGYGGGLMLSGEAQVVVEDSLFTECYAQNEGGAIATTATEEHLTMRRVTMFRCASTDRSGAMRVFGTTLLIDVHMIEPHADFGSAVDLKAPNNFTMIGGSITGGSTFRLDGSRLATSDAGAVWVHPGANVLFSGVEISNCRSAVGWAIKSDGNVRIEGCHLVGLGSDTSPSDDSMPGALTVVAGTMLLEATTIEGSTLGGPSAPTSAGCLDAAGGVVTLRNVSIARCSIGGASAAGSFIRVGPAVQLVGELVDITTDCASASPHALVRADGTSRQLAIRGLHVTNGCSNLTSPRAELLDSGTSIATCADLEGIGGSASCGAASACANQPLYPGAPPSVTSAVCFCTSPNFARATADLSAELLPYVEGCFTPRRASALDAVGVSTGSVIFRLTKDAFGQQTQNRTLQVVMEGTDTQMGADWSIGSTPFWLTVPQDVGVLQNTDSSSEFIVQATTFNVPGSEDPYTTSLNVSVQSGLDTIFEVPVFLFVTATTVGASWGTADASSSCTNTTPPTTLVSAGTSRMITFIACDRDGLKNQDQTASFTAEANLTTSQGRRLSEQATSELSVEYDDSTGEFAVVFNPQLAGSYTLTLKLSNQVVATALAVQVVCAFGQILLDDASCACQAGFAPTHGSDWVQTPLGQPCVACTGSTYAFPGDSTCSRCREGLWYSESAGSCVACPFGAVCAAGSTIDTMTLETGFWRLTNWTTDMRRCQFYDDSSKTPCQGGVVGSLCVPEGDQHGPLCEVCDTPHGSELGSYFDGSTGRCEECPNPGERTGIVLAIILGIGLLIGGAAAIYYQPPRALEGLSARLHWLAKVIEPLGLWPKFKQLIAFFQVLFSLGTVYRTSLPKEFDEWFAWVRWITFDIFDVYPPRCFGPYESRLMATAIGPLVTIAIIMLIAVLASAIFSRSIKLGAVIGGMLSLVIVWILTPPVSKVVFEVFDCEPFGFVDANVMNSTDSSDVSHWFLHADLDIRCSHDTFSSSLYDRLTALGGLFIVIWPVGMPLMFTALLVGAKRSQSSQTVISRITAPLTNEYEPLSYYWECLELLRRLIISSLMLSIPSDQSLVRLAVAMVTVFLYLILLFVVRPFRRTDDTIVAISSNVMLVFTFLTAIFVKIFDDVARVNEEQAQDLLGFQSSYDIALFLIVIGFFEVAMAIGIVLFKLRKTIRANLLEQHLADLARVQRAIQSSQQLRHPASFITFDVIRQLGEFTSHEKVREQGHLHVFDTYEMLSDFTKKHATLFVSHQWLSFTDPDPKKQQYQALLEACDALCNFKGLAAKDLYIWLECVPPALLWTQPKRSGIERCAPRSLCLCSFSSIPQINNMIKQLAIESLAVYASLCRYFISLAPDTMHADTSLVCDEASCKRAGLQLTPHTITQDSTPGNNAHKYGRHFELFLSQTAGGAGAGLRCGPMRRAGLRTCFSSPQIGSWSSSTRRRPCVNQSSSLRATSQSIKISITSSTPFLDSGRSYSLTRVTFSTESTRSASAHSRKSTLGKIISQICWKRWCQRSRRPHLTSRRSTGIRPCTSRPSRSSRSVRSQTQHELVCGESPTQTRSLSWEWEN